MTPSPADHLSPRHAVRYGLEKLAPGRHRPRHHHGDAYLTVVLAGSFEQAGYFGRHRLGAGDLIVQPTFDCHADRMLSAGVELLRLPWALDASLGAVYRGCDVESILRLAAADPMDATRYVAEEIESRRAALPITEHPVDRLASELRARIDVGVTLWAEQSGMSPEGACRAFRRLYGVNPLRYRVELRARSAWLDIVSTARPLVDVAMSNGFADQPHMTRSIRWFTGATPSAWRASSRGSKTPPR